MHLLSLAFLYAQLGMVVHAGAHLKPDQHGTASQWCGQCLNSASLQNMAGGGAVIVPAITIQHDQTVEPAVVADAPRGAFTSFRSRAPPRTF